MINIIRTLVVCALLLSTKAFGQPFLPLAATDTSGNSFYVDLNSIVRQGYPPTSATLTSFANTASTPGSSKYNCYDTSTSETLWNNVWTTAGPMSVSHILGNFACGINTSDGLWFASALIDEKNVLYLYFNGDTLEVVGPMTVDGVKLPNAIKVTTKVAGFNVNGIVNYQAPTDSFIDCGPEGGTHFIMTERSGVLKSYKLAGLNAQYVRYAICGGYFPIRVKSLAAPAQNNRNSSLDTAKDKCEELGFRKGTEKFGECVLTLSK